MAAKRNWQTGLSHLSPEPQSRMAQTCWQCHRAYLKAPKEGDLAFLQRRLCLNCAIYTSQIVQRACGMCGAYFCRGRTEGRPQFNRRRFCGHQCAGWGTQNGRAAAIRAKLASPPAGKSAPPPD